MRLKRGLWMLVQKQMIGLGIGYPVHQQNWKLSEQTTCSGNEMATIFWDRVAHGVCFVELHQMYMVRNKDNIPADNL